jgi:hypothetical protein
LGSLGRQRAGLHQIDLARAEERDRFDEVELIALGNPQRRKSGVSLLQ